MAFEIGRSKTGGRQKGSLTQRTQNFLEVMQKHNFNAAEALIETYQDARRIFESYAIIYSAIEEARIEKGERIIPTEDKADRYLRIALDAARDLASYSYPKLKAIEQEKNNPLEGMTPEQKLEAMEHAVAVLKLEVGKK